MITYDELTKLDPKIITYNGSNYIVDFCLDKNDNTYYINLYALTYTWKFEEDIVKENEVLIFREKVDIVVGRLERFNGAARNFVTYIKDIVEKFFKMYLSEKGEDLEKTLQLANYENWDGVIEL